jgi:NADH:ubiquinone reductase (H+-translocating)
MAKRIVVLGGGFAGMEATIELERRLGRDAEIVLVSEENFLLFTPLLPQIASSNINPRHIVQTIRDIRGNRRFVFRRDTVTRIDPVARRITMAEGSIDYDVLVIALGSRSDYFKTPGAAEHTWDFKTLEDAVVLRERVLDLCEHADHTADAAMRRQLLTFVIVGGGYTGVELVAELRDLMFRYVTRRFRGIAPAEIRLLLLEATPEILRTIAPRLKAHALHRLSGHGIEVRTAARVTRCSEDAVEINGTETIPTATIVWTAGVRANPCVEALPGPHDRAGRAVVNPFLQLAGFPEIFVAGDGAAAAVGAPERMGQAGQQLGHQTGPSSAQQVTPQVAPPGTQQVAPQVAPVAMAQGSVAAANAERFLRGQPFEPYRYHDKGMLVSLGMNYAVVSIGALKFSGYFAWLFWNAVHLYKLVGLKKQLQVASDWMLGTVFPRDASIIRRQRRCRICAKAGG